MEGVSRTSLAHVRERLEAVLHSVMGSESGLAATRVSTQVSAVGGLLAREYRLRRSLADQASTPAARAALLSRLVSGKVDEATLDVLRAVVESAWASPGDLLDVVTELAAQAALAAAGAQGVLDDVEDELFRFARTVEREPRLSLALSDPALPAERKDGLLRRLLEGKAQPTTLELVRQAVADTRGKALHRRLDELTRLAAARRQRLVAVVRVARALDDAQAQRLREALTRLYGRQVQLQVDLDPAVLGGAVVSVGDEIIDGSVARRLEQARARLGH